MSNLGYEREKSLDLDVYYSESYFSLQQLCSFAHQIHDIYKLKPTSILEIGIGNGFTSTYLKKAGFEVLTVDINQKLNPDICSPIDSMHSYLDNKSFDLVVCCEVLEHMPFDRFEESIRIFKGLSKRLYLTLPNYNTSYGFGGFIKFPKIEKTITSFILQRRRKRLLDPEHFWEVNYSKQTATKEITALLGKYYACVTPSFYQLNPYHLSFSCDS